MNLLQDTYAALHREGKTLSDVEWIGCDAFQITMDNFLRCADIEYDSAANAVAEDLVLVGHNFVLGRRPNSHRWVYIDLPKPPKVFKTVNSLIKTEESEARRWNDDASNYYPNSLRYMVSSEGRFWIDSV